ncbi:hypothetical protein O3M35_012157 [Rhynocoris fuscipes]|uniref:Uncharacterized protein n=1 Tax=Rhynocoris fuscipes TaxID=488301 RepID=A0AAW1CUZ9_9HEMI
MYDLSDIRETLIPRNKGKYRYPYSIVWTKIWPLTWFFPFIGHVGICTSKGVIRDFPTSYVVLKDDLAYGYPMKIWKLDPYKAIFDWDTSIAVTVKIFERREFDIYRNNCYSMVVYALNEMHYAGKNDWKGIDILLGTILFGRYIDCSTAMKTLLPSFSIFVSIATIITTIWILLYNSVLFHLYFRLLNISLNFIK